MLNFSDSKSTMLFFIIMSTYVFITISCYYSYNAYKIFKSQQLGEMGASQQRNIPMKEMNQDDNKDKAKFKAFEGKGVKIGK